MRFHELMKMAPQNVEMGGVFPAHFYILREGAILDGQGGAATLSIQNRLVNTEENLQ